MNNSSNFQKAKYTKQTIKCFRNNPYIEALPMILNEDEFIDIVNVYPDYSEEERKLPIEERLHCVDLVYEFFQGLSFHTTIESNISNIIRQGYIYRNPITPEFVKDLNIGFEAIQNKNIDMYDVNGIRRTTSFCFSIIGISGMGKTSITDRILSFYPQVVMHLEYNGIELNTPQLVWLKLECPFDGSIKGLCLEFFLQIDDVLGTNYYNKYRGGKNVPTNAMLPAIAQICKNYGLGVLVIDEIQNLNVAKSGGIEKMLNFFTSLINNVGIPIILIGTQGALDILRSKFRQARRSSGQGDIIITRLEKDDDWKILLEALFNYQWTNKKFYLTEELSDALYEESIGIIDIAIKLYVKAQKEAILNEMDIITPDLIKYVSLHDFNLIKKDIELLKSTDENDIKSSDLFIQGKDNASSIMKSNIKKVEGDAKQKEKKKVKEKKEKNVIDVDKLCDDDLRKITNKSDSNYKKLSKEGYIKGDIDKRP